MRWGREGGLVDGLGPLPLAPQPMALVRFAAQAREGRGRL
jgi:hypothetical protein